MTYFYITEAFFFQDPKRQLQLHYPINTLFLFGDETPTIRGQFPDSTIFPIANPSVDSVCRTISEQGQPYMPHLSVFLERDIQTIDVQTLFQKLSNLSLSVYFITSRPQSFSELKDFIPINPDRQEINLFDEIKEFDRSH